MTTVAQITWFSDQVCYFITLFIKCAFVNKILCLRHFSPPKIETIDIVIKLAGLWPDYSLVVLKINLLFTIVLRRVSLVQVWKNCGRKSLEACKVAIPLSLCAWEGELNVVSPWMDARLSSLYHHVKDGSCIDFTRASIHYTNSIFVPDKEKVKRVPWMQVHFCRK